MNWYVPREHGAWAMLIVPYLVGMLTSKVTLVHLIFFIGILAFYFSSGPLLTIVRQPKLKKSALPALLTYSFVGILFTLPILYLLPEILLIGLFIVPFFLMNIIFAKMKKERLFANDLCAIIALSFLVIISYYIGNSTIDLAAIILTLVNIIFFTASVFHVKTLIREKGNNHFLFKSNVFHGFTVFGFFIVNMPFIAMFFLITSLKAWFMPKDRKYKPIQIGLIEIANSVAFVIVIAIFY